MCEYQTPVLKQDAKAGVYVLNGKHRGGGSSFKGSGANMGKMSCYFRVAMIGLLVRCGNLGHTSSIGLDARLPSG